jgi:regulator of protease activity HflC (stomatin/prohibitin superfamily)
MKKVVMVVGLILMVVGGCGFRTENVPAGEEAYTVNIPLVWGRQNFTGTLTGPTSTGLSWRIFITDRIDMRSQTLSEKFDLQSSDNLAVSFGAHLVMHLKPGTCKDLVEKWGGKDWYTRNLQEPFRTYVRERARVYTAFDMKDKLNEIGVNILKDLQGRYPETPFVFESVNIGNITYPQSVLVSIEQKLAKEQELQQKSFELDISKKQAEIRVAEAEGIAKSQQIINATLTAAYLQHEAINAQLKMVDGKNTTIVYIPVGPSGLPIVQAEQYKK